MPTVPLPPRPGQHQGSGTPPLPDDAGDARDVTGKAAPLLDLRVLRDMEQDFADPSVVERFAQDFLATLEEKIGRLALRLQEGDETGAQDALLSLTTSSVMVGAERLTQAALTVQRFISAGDLDEGRLSFALLRACAAETEDELRNTYLKRP